MQLDNNCVQRLVHKREQDDQFRRNLNVDDVQTTINTSWLSESEMELVLQEIRTYSDFTQENDHLDVMHSFGCIDIFDQVFFWEIECLDIPLPKPSEGSNETFGMNRRLHLLSPRDFRYTFEPRI